MFKLLLPLMLTFSIQASAKAKKSPQYSKIATVHGMVCAFCSNSLEKKFKKNKAIKKISVDLKNQKVSIKFKKGKELSDKKISKMITASGFKVVSISDFKEGKEIDKK